MKRLPLMLCIAALVSASGAGCMQPATQADVEGAESSAYDPEPAEPIADAAQTQAEKACLKRTDWFSDVLVHTGHWGAWATCFDWCPESSYAYAMNVLSESSQGGGDDSALNAVSLHCYDKSSGAFTGYIKSSFGPEGSWRPTATTSPFNPSNPITGASLRVEGPQGSGDDTAANTIQFTDFDTEGWMVPPAEEWILAPGPTQWGSWGPIAKCPSGTAVCGVKTRVEPNNADDTRLNGLQFACCRFVPVWRP